MSIKLHIWDLYVRKCTFLTKLDWPMEKKKQLAYQFVAWYKYRDRDA